MPAAFPKYLLQKFPSRKPLNLPSPLVTLESMGPATGLAQRIFDLIGRARFFDDFRLEDIEQLATYMDAYRAQPGGVIIREGEVDDYMLLLIEGKVEIAKTDKRGQRQAMTTVGPGMTLGEMSMIDGEPRFASCVAVDPTVFAVLTRDAMVRIILERPELGAKVLIKLVSMMSQRLRQTSLTLLHYMER